MKKTTGLLLVLFFFGACDPGDRESVVLEKRITLLDLKGPPAGCVEPGKEPVYKFAREFEGEQRSCLSLKPGECAVFTGLSIHGKASLEFLLGTAKPDAPGVAVRVESLGGKSDPLILEKVHRLPAGAHGWHPIRQDLEAFVGTRIRLTLKALEEPGGQDTLIGKPVLLSEGKEVPLEDCPRIVVEEVIKDLIKDFDNVEKIRENEEKRLGAYPPTWDRKVLTAADASKKVVYATPDSEFAFTLEVSDGDYLEVSAFLYPFTTLGGKDPGNVAFSVRVDGETQFSVRSDFINDVPTDVIVYDRHKHISRIDLAPWTGRRIKITFETKLLHGEPSDQFGYCWWDIMVKRKYLISRRKASPSRPNLLLLCVDALRADHVSCYGYARRTTGNVDALAERSLLFEQAMSPSSWTMPATASILTGLHPNTHGVLGEVRSYLFDGVTMLPEALAVKGVTTGFFTANRLVCSAANFSQGSERFDEIQECAEGIHDDLFAWIEECGPHQFFGYVHYMEPHSPYSAPGAFRQHFDPEYREKRDFSGPLPERWRFNKVEKNFTPEETAHLVNLYDAEIYYWDLQFKKLLDKLDALGLTDKTVIVVTADHGEEFFDHQGLGHGWTLYNELIRVPLIIHEPRMRKGLRVKNPVSTMALFKTVIDLMGYDPPAFAQAESLLPLDKLPSRFDLLYASTESTTPESKARWATVIDPPLKLIKNTAGEGVELYHLDEDPREQRNLAKTLPGETARLLEKVESWYRMTSEIFPKPMQVITEEMRKRFEELGYIDSSKR